MPNGCNGWLRTSALGGPNVSTRLWHDRAVLHFLTCLVSISYLRPESPPHSAGGSDMDELLDDYRLTPVIVYGITDAMVMHSQDLIKASTLVWLWV